MQGRDNRARSAAAGASHGNESDSRRFEAELDFKARLSLLVGVLCWMVPPLLVFGLPLLLGDTSGSSRAAYEAIKQTTGSSAKPWLSWLGKTLVWVGKALLCTATSVVVRYQLLEMQVLSRRLPAPSVVSTP